ncbi:dTMP kinase [Candidatus Poribacteria bacterium]|nr:dTMP kinase [Candidatus Poribacteria bacterium]
MTKKGYFITIEGVEGAGKTTQIRLLAEAFNNDVVLTREPGGTILSEKIRDLFLSEETIFATTELLLIAAARTQHITELIVPALDEGKIVICDRFTDATIAYQGFRKGIDLKLVNQVNDIATNGLTPDLTFLLDLPPDIGLERKHDSSEELTRLEFESIESHEKVRNGYLSVAESQPKRVILIDARLDIDTIHQKILFEMKNRLHLSNE